jgi:hypothetical protein
MPPTSPRAAAAAAFSAFLLLSAATHAAIPFGHTIRKNDAALPDFNAAGVVVSESIAGAFFFADMDFPDGSGDTYGVPGFGYFDATAAFKWAAYVDYGVSGTSDTGTFGPLPGTPTKYFAIYNVPGGKTRVGVGTGSTLVKDFAVEFTHSADPEDLMTTVTAQNKILQLMDQGTTLSLVALNASGGLDITKNYASSLFLAAGVGSNQQYAEIAAIPDGTGYYITVQNSTTALTQNFVVIKLDSAGAVAWSRSFSMTATATTPLGSLTAQPAPNGSFLFSVVQSDSTTGVQKTHLLKFNADGSKAWANTLTGCGLTPSFFSPNSSDIWLSGAIFNFVVNPPVFQGVAARVTNASGAVSAEFRPTGSSNLLVTAVTSDAAYLNIYNPSFPTRSLVGKVAAGSSTASGFVRNDTLGTAFITTRDTTGSVSSEFDVDNMVARVIGYDTGFQSVVAVCPDYAASAISMQPSALSSAALAVTPAAAVVTASARTTTLTPVTALPIHALALKIDPYQAASPPLNLPLTTTRDGAGHLLIGFTSKAATTYSLLYSPDLKTAFQQVQTLSGTGAHVAFTVNITAGGKGFYKVSDGSP